MGAGAADGDFDFPEDVSNSVFTILPNNNISSEYLELVAPNGTEKWAVNSVQHVVWYSDNLTHNVNLDLTIDNGATWNDLYAPQNEISSSSKGCGWTR